MDALIQMCTQNAFCNSLDPQIKAILFTEFQPRAEIIGVCDIHTLVQANADVSLTETKGNTPQQAREEERMKNGESGDEFRSDADCL